MSRMPSASTKPENKAPPEGLDPFKAAVSVVERKVRNLEKRKGKLDQYRLKSQQGEALNEDQKQAIRNYEVVTQNLEFARELQKQFQDIQVDTEKLLKKQLRKEKKEKQEKQAAEVKRMHDLLQLQGLLDNMGVDTVRAHFKTGKHGAVVLAEDDLNQLDKLYKLISPSRDNEENYEEQTNQAAEHITNLLDAKEKEAAGSTYKALKELVDNIVSCGYFDNFPYEDKDEDIVEEKTEAEPEPVEEAAVEPEPVAEETTEEVMEPVPEEAPQVPAVEPTPQLPQQATQEPTPDVKLTEAVVNYEDDSFFSTPTFSAGQRPFQDIVSSVQGTFNFVQESQIGSETPHIDPAVVKAQPMTPALHQSQKDALHGTTFQGVNMLSGEDPLTQQQPTQQQPTQQQQQQQQQPDSRMGDPAAQAPVPQSNSLESSYQTSQDYSQSLMTQGLTASTAHSYADQSSALGHSHSHGSMDQSVVMAQGISASTDMPPTIPLPNQSSLQGAQDQTIITEGQEKKPFAMNPNAAAFQSMYNPSLPHSQNSQMALPNSMHEEKGLSHQNEFQNNGFGGNFGGRSSNGGPRGGSRGSSRGGRGGMSNGFSRGSRGGGGPYNSGRGGNYNSNRGNSGRGAYQGYPPRNDYRPEGFQSYSNGYSNGSTFNKRGGGSAGAARGNSMRGGAMRGGPPRGGSERGRGPSRSGFGSRPNPVQVQQTA